MQSIALGETGRTTSRLGFGCSSVLGALNRRDSLAMLEAAFDAGVRHFDVAPMYGYGEAEGCLGEFLARHAGQTTVTTKYGIPVDTKQGMKSLARSMARPVLKLLPGVKKQLAGVAAKAGGAGVGAKAAFMAHEARVSLERSLRELRVERIDLWLLHEASATDLADDGLLRLLEDSVVEGKIGSFGMGSGGDKIPALLTERPEYCRALQYEWSVRNAAIPAGGPFRIHHRALTDNFRSLHNKLAGNPAICKQWSRETGLDVMSSGMLAELMLKTSLVMNPESVILFSSKNPKHIQENVRVAGDETLEAPARRFYELMQAHGAELFAGDAR
jgi:D-threo-aldose 1-dehydrogenase